MAMLLCSYHDGETECFEAFMKSIKKVIVVLATLAFVGGNFLPQTALGLTVKEEEDLSREVMRSILQHYEFIEDPIIVAYVNKVGDRVASYFPDRLFNFKFYVIKTDGYNAFAIPGGHVFIYSGLLEAMQNEDQLAGILAHEIAHVYCRHISQQIDKSKKITMASVAGIAAGILVGMTGGGGKAAQAVTTGSMAAGQSAMLAYSRDNEMQADQIGLKYLEQAGYSGEGLLEILKKIRSQQWFGSDQIPTYLMTHPAVEDRIAYIDSQLQTLPKTDGSSAPARNEEFERIHIHLLTRYGNEDNVLASSKTAVEKNPEDPMAHYQYGLILARAGRYEDAVNQIRRALEKRAFDPYILNDLGWIYVLDGQYQKALSVLESVYGQLPDDPQCLQNLGLAQMELGQLKEASDKFYALIEKYPHYKEGYNLLGQCLGKQGNLADAYYYLGTYYLKAGDYKNADVQLRRALKYTQDEDRRQKIEKLLGKMKSIKTGEVN
jgi:predicted Zn-dependent protease